MSESASSGTVSSHAGRCPGQRFSKNRSPVTPSGSRSMVTGRSCRWGSIDRGDPGVVVDDLTFGEARRRVQHLFEVRDLAAVDPRPPPRSRILDVGPRLRWDDDRARRAGRRPAKVVGHENGETALPTAIWTGSISFGLVTVPVRLVSATRSQDVRFHQLEAETGARIRYRRVLGADRRRGPERPDREGLRARERPLRGDRARRARRAQAQGRAARSRSRTSSTCRRSTRSTSSSRTTWCPTRTPPRRTVSSPR